MKLFTFGKSRRLRTNSQFKAVIVHRAYVTDRLFKVWAAANDCEFSRLGISLSKSVGSAVVRNRLKRLLCEAFRLNQRDIPEGFDYVVICRYNWWTSVADCDGPKTAVKRLKLRQVADSFVRLAGLAAGKIKPPDKTGG